MSKFLNCSHHFCVNSQAQYSRDGVRALNLEGRRNKGLCKKKKDKNETAHLTILLHFILHIALEIYFDQVMFNNKKKEVYVSHQCDRQEFSTPSQPNQSFLDLMDCFIFIFVAFFYVYYIINLRCFHATEYCSENENFS